MGDADVVIKKYMQNEDVTRDAIRLALPDLQVGCLRPLDAEESIKLFDLPPGSKKDRLSTIARFRDVFLNAQTLTDGKTDFVLIGFENQNYVDYAMPVRVLLENAIDYAWQVSRIRKKHQQEAIDKGETVSYPVDYLSGLQPGDLLNPVVTIVIYWSTEPWPGPMHLQNLIKMPSGLPAEFVDNNNVLMIQPALLTDEQIASCHSSLQQVLKYIRSSKDKELLWKTLQDDDAFQCLDVDAAHVIESVVKSGIPIPKNTGRGETVNMCGAIQEMMDDVRQSTTESVTKSVTRKMALKAALRELKQHRSVEEVEAVFQEDWPELQAEEKHAVILEAWREFRGLEGQLTVVQPD